MEKDNEVINDKSMDQSNNELIHLPNAIKPKIDEELYEILSNFIQILMESFSYLQDFVILK